AAQRDAARRAPLAEAGGDRRLRLRAVGEDEPGRANFADAIALLETRTDDSPRSVVVDGADGRDVVGFAVEVAAAAAHAGAQRRDEPHRREHARAGSD